VATQVLAVELVCACQALDLLAPIVSSDPLMRVHRAVRASVPVLTADRPPSADIDAAEALIRTGAVEYAAGIVVN
jgi:histidine ammonia-lyase